MTAPESEPRHDELSRRPRGEDSGSFQDLPPTISLPGAKHAATSPRDHGAVAPPRIPDSIGQYRILGLLGEGGMGLVWEAEQRHPRRRVALKVMRQGHLVDEVHARMFHREAETLGRLRHPSIAAIYESGHTEDGHDYFAMELVQGGTLDRWLRSRPPAHQPGETELRLRMFISLCDAVHYAHQRGVVHRDLKPRNIVVSDHALSTTGTGTSSQPVLKILDFGLARISDVDAQAFTMRSEVGAIKGTLPYMSPEQARGDVDALDLRTDVYSLGVILYEMMTLQRPYELQGMSLLDAVRVICEATPRPLNQSAGGGRGCDPDLETIVAKALAKEPERRYRSAAALAEDVERYLASQPIMARRPSALYRARKFARRHRFGVAATALTVLALILGVVGISAGLLRAKEAEARARQQAAASDEVSRFLADLLASLDPAQVGQTLLDDLERRVADSAVDSATSETAAVAAFRQSIRGISVTDAGRHLVDTAILSHAGQAIGERFADQPDVAGRLEHTLAETYERLGLYAPALAHARLAVTYRQAASGAQGTSTLRSKALLGVLLFRQGQLIEAETLLAKVLASQRRILGDGHPDSLVTARSLSWVYLEQGRYAEAESLLEATIEVQRSLLGQGHRETTTSMNSLAVVYTDQGRYAEAEALHSELLAVRSATLGETHPDTLKSMTNLAVVSFYQGRLDSAEALFHDVYEIQRRTLGPAHPTTLGSATNLAIIYERQQRYAEAEALHREALEIKRRVLGEEHPETLSSVYNLAVLCSAQGRHAEAERLHRATYEARRRLLGADNPQTLESLCALAGVAALWGDRDLAIERLRRAVEAGYSRADALAADADFASLRDDAEFEALLARARRQAESTGD